MRFAIIVIASTLGVLIGTIIARVTMPPRSDAIQTDMKPPEVQ